MRRDLFKKFMAQHDYVFMRIARQARLVSSVVPDPRFAEKIETRAMHHFGVRGQTVRAKEDRRAECSFKRTNQSSILFTTFTHAEGLQHFGSALELNRLTFLLDGQCRQEDWNNPVLPERNSIIRMTSDLQNELTVPAFIEELIGRQTADGEST